MQFRIITGEIPAKSRSVVLLRHTGWDDWFKYSTLYQVTYVDAVGDQHVIGWTKIGRIGLKPARSGECEEGLRYPRPPKQFSQLSDEFFSLGQDASFYEALTTLGGTIRDTVLKSLRDIAYDLDLLRVAEREEVTRVSLLREVPIVTVREQMHRLSHGGARLTPYALTFPLNDTKPEPVSLEFSVDPDSRPPSNIQVRPRGPPSRSSPACVRPRARCFPCPAAGSAVRSSAGCRGGANPLWARRTRTSRP